MASPSSWTWSAKASIPQTPLTTSTFTFSSVSFLQIGSNGRIHHLLRSSSHDSPSSTSSSSSDEPGSVNPDSEISHFSDKRLRGISPRIGRSPETEATVSGDERFTPPQYRKPRLRLGLKSFGRRPLWKRIFFASKKVRSIILLNVLTVIYASNIPVVKEVEMIMDPALFTVVRFVVSAIPFLPFVLQARGDCKTRSAGIELGFWVSLGYLTQALGLLTSDAGRASFISAFTVIVVPLIDGMFGAKVSALTWSGAVVSLIGVALLESSGSPPSVGDILNILSAVFFGIHMLRTEHISRSTKKEKFLPLLGYEVCSVALLSIVWYFFSSIYSDVHHLSLGSWSWIAAWNWMVSFPWIPALYSGIFSTGLCLWAELACMRDVSATETAVIYGLEPFWGAAFAWFLLGERWGTVGWIGAALVLCGSLTVQIMGSTPEKSKNEEHFRQHNHLVSRDKQRDLSLSAVVINSKKNVADLFKKRSYDAGKPNGHHILNDMCT